MGIFTKVMGCKGVPVNNQDAELFNKRFIKCTGCPAEYNSRMCHRAMHRYDLSLAFE